MKTELTRITERSHPNDKKLNPIYYRPSELRVRQRNGGVWNQIKYKQPSKLASPGPYDSSDLVPANGPAEVSRCKIVLPPEKMERNFSSLSSQIDNPPYLLKKLVPKKLPWQRQAQSIASL